MYVRDVQDELNTLPRNLFSNLCSFVVHKKLQNDTFK